MVRTTGFGQTGPYATRPGFGTLAESMTGYAHTNGFPDGPPTLPPFALGDGVAAMTGAFAAMMALWWRDTQGGTGQVIDLSIYEPLFWILGPHAIVYQQLGIVQGRTGNRAPFTAPRNAYLAKDGKWLGVSASAQSIAERVMTLVGRPELTEEPWFADHTGRLEHQDELDDAISAWIAERDSDEVVRAFEEVHAAIAPVLSIDEIVLDPQFIARDTITEVDHPKLGPLQMQNVIPRLVETPGQHPLARPRARLEQRRGPARRARPHRGADRRARRAPGRRGRRRRPTTRRSTREERQPDARSLQRERRPGPAARRRRLRAPRPEGHAGPTARGSRSSLVLNWEEGSEYSKFAGDERNEGLAEIPYAMEPEYRDLAAESVYEYGSRAGVWRLQRLFDEFERQ